MDTSDKRRLYVVSDVHGFFDELRTALDEAGFFDDVSATLILLGDALDRGEQTREVVDFLLKLNSENFDESGKERPDSEKRLIYIRGNHEDLFSDALYDVCKSRFFDGMSFATYGYNGTFDSMCSIAGMSEDEAHDYPEMFGTLVRESRYYRELLPTARDYYETDGYIFTHGWIPTHVSEENGKKTYSYNPEWREADRDAWRQARWLNGMEICCTGGVREPRKVVVCGHICASWGHCNVTRTCDKSWRSEHADRYPFVAPGIIAIDGGYAQTKKTNIVVIEA